MTSMGEVSSEGEGQYWDWVYEHVSEEGVAFIKDAEEAGTISADQARLLVEEAVAILSEDPYSSESYQSPWEKADWVERVYLVSSYHQSRRYGGAEEGGWWYDHRDPLTKAYGEHHGRSFLIWGPFRDKQDAYEVARNLNAMEQIGMPRGCESSIVWRVEDHAPMSTPRAVYC